MMTNKRIKQLFSQLTEANQSKILDELLQEQEVQGKALKRAEKEVVSKRKKKPCPYCKNEDVYKQGHHATGVQMYSCKKCQKWYSETSGTALYRACPIGQVERVNEFSEGYGTSISATMAKEAPYKKYRHVDNLKRHFMGKTF